MISASSKTLHAVKILGYSCQIIASYPSLLGIMIAEIGLMYGGLVLFMMLEYRWFGIWIVDFSTFSKMLQFEFAQHLGQIGLWIGFLWFNVFISACLSYIYTYKLMQLTDKEWQHQDRGYIKFISSFKELIRHACIMTCEHLILIFSVVEMRTHLMAVQDLCDGSYEIAARKYQQPLTILLYPLMVDNPGTALKKLRYQSTELLQSKFTRTAEKQYAFFYITFFFIVLTGITLSLLYIYRLISRDYAFLIGLMLIMLYMGIVRLLATIFEAAVYYYCTQGVQSLYPQALMNILFKAQDQDTLTFSEKKMS